MNGRLLRAWRLTAYRVEDVPIRIGRPVPALRGAGARHAVLLTAWNPGARRMPLGWNRRMQDRLLARLRRRTVLEAEGALAGWREAHVCVLGDPRPALVLARRFRQRAVVLLRTGVPARLWLLG